MESEQSEQSKNVEKKEESSGQASNQITQENQYEEIPKETMIQLLKDKQKEIKTIQTKLNTLESKYVKTFKQKKLENKDRETFLSILTKIFNEKPYLFEPKPVGENTIEQMEELYQLRESIKNKEISEKQEQLDKEKQELESNYQKKLDISINSMDSKNQQIVQNLKKMKQEQENNSSKLAKEILELNDMITQKNKEIEQLKLVEDEYQQYKADILLKELQKSKIRANNDIQSRMKESEKRDNIIKLKNELEMAYDQIQKHEQTIQEQDNLLKQKNISKQSQQPPVKKQSFQMQEKQVRTISIQTDFLMTKPLFRSSSIEESPEQDNKYHVQELQQSMIQLGEQDINFDTQPSEFLSIFIYTLIRILDKKQETSSLNQEYLKNVILKYFVYQESKNYRQATLLQNSIMTILRMTPLERQKIESARVQGSIWTSAKTWLTWSKYQEVQFPKSGSGGGEF